MSVKNVEIIKSILIVDDEDESLELYSGLIRDKLEVEIITTKYPTQALNFASDNFFDLILIDVTINYNGSPFGGFEIYKSLTGRYGDSSLIAYSKFITDDLLKQYNYNFNFIEKGTNTIRFVERIIQMINSLRVKQTCFIAMPFESKYDDVYHRIKSCVERNLYCYIRVDKQNFNKSIIQKIFEEIKNCKLFIFLATDRNPNAFYECGFAIALDKEIITITDSYKNLPFDIRDRNAIAYGKGLKKLEFSLMEKLSSLTEINGKLL